MFLLKTNIIITQTKNKLILQKVINNYLSEKYFVDPGLLMAR